MPLLRSQPSLLLPHREQALSAQMLRFPLPYLTGFLPTYPSHRSAQAEGMSAYGYTLIRQHLQRFSSTGRNRMGLSSLDLAIQHLKQSYPSSYPRSLTAA